MFHTNFSITAAEFSFPRQLSGLKFLLGRLLMKGAGSSYMKWCTPVEQMIDSHSYDRELSEGRERFLTCMIYVAHVEIFQREDKVPDLYDLHSSRLAGSGPNNLHDLAHVSEVGSEQHIYVPHNISQMQVRI